MSPSLLDLLFVLGVAAAPVTELRGAIPLAIAQYHMAPLAAYWISFMGNLVPVVILLLFLERLAVWGARWPMGERAIGWLFERTRRRFSASMRRWGALALVLIVAVPLPMTGAWTGSIIAFLFGVRFRYAFPLIALGVAMAGVIVTLATVGVLALPW